MKLLELERYRSRRRVVYLSACSDDSAALCKAIAEADRIGLNSGLAIEPLNEWGLFRQLLRQDARGLISLELVIFEKGTHPIKELLFRKYGRIADSTI